MSIDPAILRAMADAGASMEVILAAVDAAHAMDGAKLAEKRAKDAARQRKSRANRELSHDVTVTTSDERDTSPHSPPKDPTPQNTPPIIPPHSEANASARPAAALPVDEIWNEMPRLLADLSGRSEVQVRKWIGKVLSQHTPDAALKAMRSAVEAKTGDPFGYVTRILNPPPDHRSRGSPPWAQPAPTGDQIKSNVLAILEARKARAAS